MESVCPSSMGLKKRGLVNNMVETAWDYLFFSFKANLPLQGTYRTDLDKLQKAVNTIVEIELESKKRVGAVEELERLLKRAKKIPEDLWAVTIIEKRLFQLNGTKEKGFGE